MKKLKEKLLALKNELIKLLHDWKKYKPIRGKIEDFFKVLKQGLSLNKNYINIHLILLKIP